MNKIRQGSGTWVCLRAGLLVFVLGLIAGIPGTAYADPPPNYELIYAENFESDPLEGWTMPPNCGISIIDGNRVLGCEPSIDGPGPVPGMAVLEDFTIGDGPFFLRYRFLTETGFFSNPLMLNQTPADVQGYFFTYIAEQGVLESNIFRKPFNSPGESVSEFGPIDFLPTTWYSTEISYDSGVFVQIILLDGEFVGALEFGDADPFTAGQFGFAVSSGEVFIDDIEIWTPAGAVPPEPPIEPEEYVFTGNVHNCPPDVISEPLEGVTVGLFGSNDPHPDEGRLLDEIQTDPVGFYTLRGPSGFEYYAVRMFPPEGFIPREAESLGGGTVQDPDWIEYAFPPVGGERRGDLFCLNPIEPDPEVLVFSGQVFVGEPGDRGSPLEGVTVELYGAEDPDPIDEAYLDGVDTEPDGFFELSTDPGFGYFSLRLLPTDDYVSIVAVSPGGEVRDADWIQFPEPLANRPTDRNEFYMLPTRPPEVIPVWNYPDCIGEDLRLLANSFDSGNADNWELDGWWIENGFLQSDGEAYASYPMENWEQTSLRLGLYLADGGDLLIHLHDDEGQKYKFFIRPGEVALEKIIDFEDVYSDSQGIPFEAGQWVEVELAARDGSFWIALDGEVVLRAPDASPLDRGNLWVENLSGSPVLIDVLWACGQILETPDETSPIWPWIVGGILLLGLPLLLIGGLALIVRRLFFRGPGDPSKPGPMLPPTPGLPPIRLVNAWLTEGPGDGGRVWRLDNTLASNGTYMLNVQVQPRQQVPRSGAPPVRPIPLDVVFYSIDGELLLPESRAIRVLLPEGGSSGVVRLSLRPNGTGQKRVRVGIYYQNTLLQSVVLDMQVTERRRKKGDAIRRTIDYVASSRFMDLNSLGASQLSIFTNQAGDGDRWIGLFSNAEGSPGWLQQGAVHKFSTSLLTARAADARNALSKIAGERIYRLDYSLPMDRETLAQRATDLIGLAKSGYKLFDALFQSILGAQDKDYLRGLSELLGKTSSTVSVARCRDDGSSFPWSALYSYYLDETQELELCPVFAGWLAEQSVNPGEGPDVKFLEDPEVCHARSDCPLGTEAGDRTVCPFGFWGFIHQVEQPLQLVEPVPVNQVPQELIKPEYEETSRILRIPGEQLRMGMAVYAGFNELESHQGRLRQLADPSVLELTASSDFNRVRSMLTEGGRHLLYFFCHGRTVDGRFVLEVGDRSEAQQLSASGLDWLEIDWPKQPQTLVFINACESMAITPELVHGFMGKLRNLGASGVIGVEINNWSQFAAPFAERLLEELLEGRTLGEAILRTRRSFLREGNPLGLVYSLHGPAHLHLHAQAGCSHCAELEINQG